MNEPRVQPDAREQAPPLAACTTYVRHTHIPAQTHHEQNAITIQDARTTTSQYGACAGLHCTISTRINPSHIHHRAQSKYTSNTHTTLTLHYQRRRLRARRRHGLHIRAPHPMVTATTRNVARTGRAPQRSAHKYQNKHLTQIRECAYKYKYAFAHARTTQIRIRAPACLCARPEHRVHGHWLELPLVQPHLVCAHPRAARDGPRIYTGNTYVEWSAHTRNAHAEWHRSGAERGALRRRGAAARRSLTHKCAKTDDQNHSREPRAPPGWRRLSGRRPPPRVCACARPARCARARAYGKCICRVGGHR